MVLARDGNARAVDSDARGGVGPMTDNDKNDYVSPDEYMKNKEYYDHKAMESRHRVISNASNNRL